MPDVLVAEIRRGLSEVMAPGDSYVARGLRTSPQARQLLTRSKMRWGFRGR